MEPTQAGQVVVIGRERGENSFAPAQQHLIGLIGRSWAMVFAGGGFRVKLYDVVQQQITTALEYISKEMKELEKSGMLKGTLSAEKQLSLISGCTDLKTAVEGAMFIQEGVVSPADLDLVMSDGLGMRYAFIGPLETMHLNAEGMTNYCERYREGMIHVLNTFGPVPDFSGEIEQQISQAMSEKTPADPEHLNARRAGRDECLMGLAKLKEQMKSN
ncbi:lambda-crystallin homolog isoform X4 [Chelonia mydas]|uniref:lambda-crystallin homolog isoform X4 n=1 Tax=Chelonia mydas TaxID=8469 RepID=UPI0018A1F41C|nr:lambda-crystallin homolog isoform X4 [Chelonia mydas]